MGNPAIRIEPTAAAEPAKPAANGILTYVPAASIGAGADQLPRAGDGQSTPREVVLEVPHLGAVRITYTLNRYKHGRSWHWHWRAVRADAVGEGESGAIPV